MNSVLLSALAEPNRLRIVELLRDGARTVGEISRLLELRQPQVTKHLQALEKAGLVGAYPFGQRRIYALKAVPLKELRNWIDTFEPTWSNPSKALDEYLTALQREQKLADKNSSWADGRTVKITRKFAASRETLWRFWTDATDMKKWWSPDHMTTARVEAEPWPGGKLRVDMADADGFIHIATGHYVGIKRPEELRLIMSPLDDEGRPAFEAHQTVTFDQITENKTEVTLDIRLAASTATAVAFIAGIELGWNQTLDKLTRALADERGVKTSM